MMPVHQNGCIACIDAGMDFDWCRVCGRGRPEIPLAPDPESPLSRSARVASGKLNGDEVVAGIEAWNRGRRGEGDFDVADNGDGTFTVTRKGSTP